MARGGAKADQRPIIIVKRVKKGGGGHHGGAWKVAYADFVTAMMAFFMLLWLLTVTDKQTLKGIADYFTPSRATMSNSSGSGSILGGTALQREGANSSGTIAIAVQQAPTPSKNSDDDGAAKDAAKSAALMKLQQDVQSAIQESPTLANYQNQVILDVTPEGLRIQLVDKDNKPMFHSATADLYPYAEQLIRTIGGVVSAMPNRISIQGHTDDAGNSESSYSNWELSSDRANAARRILNTGKVAENRFAEVVGKASTDPLYPDTPNRSENRRVTFIVLNEAPVVAPSFSQ